MNDPKKSKTASPLSPNEETSRRHDIHGDDDACDCPPGYAEGPGYDYYSEEDAAALEDRYYKD